MHSACLIDTLLRDHVEHPLPPLTVGHVIGKRRLIATWLASFFVHLKILKYSEVRNKQLCRDLYVNITHVFNFSFSLINNIFFVNRLFVERDFVDNRCLVHNVIIFLRRTWPCSKSLEFSLKIYVQLSTEITETQSSKGIPSKIHENSVYILANVSHRFSQYIKSSISIENASILE